MYFLPAGLMFNKANPQNLIDIYNKAPQFFKNTDNFFSFQDNTLMPPKKYERWLHYYKIEYVLISNIRRVRENENPEYFRLIPDIYQLIGWTFEFKHPSDEVLFKLTWH